MRLTRATLALAAAALAAPRAFAGTLVETDAGASYAATRNEAAWMDCDETTIERRLLGALRPTWRSRDTVVAGKAAAAARDVPAGAPEVFDSSGELSVETRSGRHALQAALGASYVDEEARYGCAADPGTRLQRQRDVENRVLIPGSSTRTRSGRAAYVYGRETDKMTLSYDVVKRMAAQDDTSHAVTLRGDKALARNVAAYALAGGGATTGSFDEFASAHAGTGLKWTVDTRWELGADADAESRDTRERRWAGSATSTWRLTRQTETTARLQARRFEHSQSASERQGELGVTTHPKDVTLSAMASRIDVDDAAGSHGEWYDAGAAYAFTRKQSVALAARDGRPTPTLLKHLTSTTAVYSLALGPAAALKDGATPRAALSASYGVTKLRSYEDDDIVVRQTQLAVTATF